MLAPDLGGAAAGVPGPGAEDSQAPFDVLDSSPASQQALSGWGGPALVQGPALDDGTWDALAGNLAEAPAAASNQAGRVGPVAPTAVPSIPGVGTGVPGSGAIGPLQSTRVVTVSPPSLPSAAAAAALALPPGAASNAGPVAVAGPQALTAGAALPSAALPNTSLVMSAAPTGPVIANPGNQKNAEGDTVSLQITAAGQGSLMYGASNLPLGLAIDSGSGLIHGTLDYSDAETQGGNYAVTVYAMDGSGGMGSQSFTWTVTDTNAPPVLTNPGNQTNMTGDAVALQLQASSPTGSGLVYGASGLPPGLSISGTTGVISGVVSSIAAGTSPYSVTVMATQTSPPVTATATFTWTINHVLLTAPGDQSNTAGDPASLQLQAVDPDGDALQYGASNLPPGLSISSGGLISGTIAAAAAAGSPYTVTVTAADGINVASQSFTWSVAHLGMLSPGDQTNGEGDAVSLQIDAFDADGDALSYSASGLPPGLSISTQSGLISGNVAPLASDQSPYSVTVSASDGSNSASQTFAWNVTHVLLANPGDQYDKAGDTVSLQVSGSDPDGDTLVYAAAGLPPGLTVNPQTGRISGTIAAPAPGASPYSVTVTASDGPHEAQQSFTWTVSNSVISISNPGPQGSAEGATVSLGISAADPDGDFLTYAAAGLPPGLGISVTTGQITGTIDYSAAETNGGSYLVSVLASDGNGDSGNVQFAWTVTDVSQAPQFADNPGALNNETGDVVSFPIDAYDPDGKPLSYSGTGLPSGVTIDPGTGIMSGTISGTAASPNPYNVTISISDGSLGASESFPWTVSNGGITVTSPGDQTNAEGASISLQISATDPNSQTLTYAALNLPAGLGINSATGQITGSVSYSAAEGPTDPYTVVISVSDPNGQTGNTSFAWTVTDTPQPPVLTNPGNQTSAEGASVSLQLSASDPNGQTLTYVATGLPAGLSVDPQTGLISGDVSYAAADTAGGSYTVHVAVSDESNLSASQAFTWTATETAQKPSLTSPGDETNRAGTALTLPIQASDPDGASLSYSASGLPPGLGISATTGTITGMIASTAATGSPYTVNLVATAANGPTASTALTWIVVPPGNPAVEIDINDTVTQADDLALVGATIPARVTLHDPTAGAHQIHIVAPPSVELDKTGFELTDGGSQEIMITALQVSQVEDDVFLQAQVDGQNAGGKAMTNAKVSLPNIDADDTPPDMPQDRIPPRVHTSVGNVTIQPVLQNKELYICKYGSGSGNGDFLIQARDGTGTGCRGPITGVNAVPLVLIGLDGSTTQTTPGHANALTIGVEMDGKKIEESNHFSVAAIPETINMGEPELARGNMRHLGTVGGIAMDRVEWGAIYPFTVVSDSGVSNLSDLNFVLITEEVINGRKTGIFQNDPPRQPTAWFPATALGPFDMNGRFVREPAGIPNEVNAAAGTLRGQIKAAGNGVLHADQDFLFFDGRTGRLAGGRPSTAYTVPESGFSLRLVAERTGEGLYFIRVTRTAETFGYAAPGGNANANQQDAQIP